MANHDVDLEACDGEAKEQDMAAIDQPSMTVDDFTEGNFQKLRKKEAKQRGIA